MGDNDTQVQNTSAETGNHRSKKLDRTWEAEMRRGTKEKQKKQNRKGTQDMPYDDTKSKKKSSTARRRRGKIK